MRGGSMAAPRRGGVTGEGARMVLATLAVGEGDRGAGVGLPTRVLDARDDDRGMGRARRREPRMDEPNVP